jgi:hypothetical protein
LRLLQCSDLQKLLSEERSNKLTFQPVFFQKFVLFLFGQFTVPVDCSEIQNSIILDLIVTHIARLSLLEVSDQT